MGWGIIIRFSSARLSSTSFFLFSVLTCNRVLPGFVWDASGLMVLAADPGASRNAPIIPKHLQVFPTPTLGRCLSTLVAAAQHSVPSPLRWASPQKPLTLHREARLGGAPPSFEVAIFTRCAGAPPPSHRPHPTASLQLTSSLPMRAPSRSQIPAPRSQLLYSGLTRLGGSVWESAWAPK